MGLGLFRHSGSCSTYTNDDKKLPEPGDFNFSKFKIIKTLQIGAFTIAKIKYPSCNNYEGEKICLYQCREIDLRNANLLDPHFSEDRTALVPLARFEPTNRGWRMAQILADELSERWDGKGF